MLIILPIVLGLSAFHLSKFIRINATMLYLVAMVIAGFSIVLPTTEWTNIINSGLLGLSFLIVVMYTGAFTRGSQIKRQLGSVRREYAILGFILITPHAYLNIVDTIINYSPLSYFGILTYLFMIPLFITSFKYVKSKIRTSKWIKYHRLSYFLYFTLFIHSINVSPIEDVLTYYIIFGTYSIIKLGGYYFKSYPYLKATTITLVIGVSGMVFITDLPGYFEEPINLMENNNFEDGVYIGTARGYRGLTAEVTVLIKNNNIEYVIVNDCGCTPYADEGYFSDSAYQIASDITILNRTDVDSVTGATKTSEAVNKAVINALEKAIAN